MDPSLAAEELPALYRAVLDCVGRLEADGQRDVAGRIRSEASRIYSRAWDARARRGLELLLRRHAGTPLTQPAPGRATRRRTSRAA